ncbi:DUF4275 family protein [Aporhodopirellula aestuarii]|uniref:DUF4275 family protein n=1 Tax=Aporhodopirellula aestuarii TaxID=2950107 RepID=A0ABT0UEG1_9BACT|nr:DUF4275 family protein [Aporhodopirellula aestuarii]MCM2375099.1 DUF4275 family protein [Aporhodopirellula aestuarii]
MHQTRDYPPDEFRIKGRVFRETLKSLTRTFFADVYRQTGSYAYRGLLWHAFTYGFQSALERTDAVSAFVACDDAELYIHDEQLDMLWLCPRSVAISDTYPCNDTYIFPPSFSWLYITTHEHAQGIGPFFVRAPSNVVECG